MCLVFEFAILAKVVMLQLAGVKFTSVNIGAILSIVYCGSHWTANRFHLHRKEQASSG